MCTATGKAFYRGINMPDNATKVIESIGELRGYCSARNLQIKTLVMDAGKINTSAEVRKYLEKKHILIQPTPPKAQYLNTVERYIEVWDDKMAAIIATARQGSTLTDAVWYSAAVTAFISLDTQLRPTYSQTMTPYEAFEGKQPNLEEIFKFRLGQIVTVTQLTDQRSKTDHNLAGVTCYVLHPDVYTRNTSGTWVFCPHPDVRRAYLRSNRDIQIVEFEDIENQSIMSFQPTHNTHPTYPAEDIVKFIDGKANMQQRETTVMQPANQRTHRDPYIDCKVRKKFGRKFYMGTVDHAWFGKDSEIYYHVIYEDGENEDLVEKDLKEIVIEEPQSSTIRPERQTNSTEGLHADADIAEYYETNNSEKAQQYSNLVDDYEHYYEDAYESPTTVHMINSNIFN